VQIIFILIKLYSKIPKNKNQTITTAKKVIVILPALNVEKTLEKTFEEIPKI
jgi:hypothetical protein